MSVAPDPLRPGGPDPLRPGGPDPLRPGGPDPLGPSPTSSFKSCWSCRLVSGGGLVFSGAYVFNAARRVMRQGGMTSAGTVAQITFAACLTALGVVVIADPVGKSDRKT